MVNCFVAMPFGRKDCDKIYEKGVLPVLKELSRQDIKINPIVINRKLYREDINVKIMRELKRADLAIVDLTYERPSVYFEAGYIEGKFSYLSSEPTETHRVAYIASQNEISRKNIHFDLDKKQIIPWDYERISIFRKMLRKRLQYLLKPIIVKDENQKKEDLRRKEFSSLSQNLRFEKIASLCKKHFSGLGYKLFYPVSSIDSQVYKYLRGSKMFVLPSCTSKTVIMTYILLTNKLSKRDLNGLGWRDLFVNDNLIKCMTQQYLIVSMEKTSSALIQTHFKDASAIDANRYMVPAKKVNEMDIGRPLKYIYTISPVRDFQEFTEKISALSLIKGNPQTKIKKPKESWLESHIDFAGKWASKINAAEIRWGNRGR